MHQASRTEALDPVANFHLGNGAEVAGLSWAVSQSGIDCSSWIPIGGRATRAACKLTQNATCNVQNDRVTFPKSGCSAAMG